MKCLIITNNGLCRTTTYNLEEARRLCKFSKGETITIIYFGRSYNYEQV
jgi:hypothetical protein